MEAGYKWTFTSTGTGKAYNARNAERLTLHYEASSGCTATIALQHRLGSSAAPFSVLSSQALAASGVTTDQFSGPLKWIAPRVTDKTAGSSNVVTVYLMGN